MKLLRIQSLSRPTQYLHQLALRLLLVIPLLATGTISGFALFSANPAEAAQDSGDFSSAQLDQMLAPIALYPDTLLSQVLIASTYPLEVIQADRWVRSNKDLKADDALKFAQNKDWDPSVQALVAFPDILQRMSDDVDWMQNLGDAFLNNEGDVMDSVQRLRKRAYATGNLEKAQHISVERDDNHIIIEPAEERIVYVPVYDTRVVYGNWWWPDYPPVYWRYPSHYTYVSGFYWGTRIYLGSNYFYSACHWRDRRVVVIDRHNHYGANAHFYTGRSIIHSSYSRSWSHNPMHRQGVAYHNNRLRDNYHSPRPSYQDDRQYRAQHRDAGRDFGQNDRYNSPRTNPNNSNADKINARTMDRTNQFDRAEQVRERLNRNNGNTYNRSDNLGSANSNNGWTNTNRGEAYGTNSQQNNGNNRAQNRPGSTTTTNFALPQANTGTQNVRSDDAMNRQRAALQAERTNDARERFTSERSFTRESNPRPEFSGASQRPEQAPRESAPQPVVERSTQATPELRDTAPSPQRPEGLAEQRAARGGDNNSRFSR